MSNFAEKYGQTFDMPSIRRYLLGGAALGGGAAALLNLFHYLNQKRKSIQEKNKKEKTDENTIVITLPSSIVESSSEIKKSNCSSNSNHSQIVKEDPARVKEMNVDKKTKQLRHEDGKYSIKVKSGEVYSWPTIAAQNLAFFGGTALSAILINKLYEKMLENELNKKLDAARIAYLKTLQEKTSGFDDIFDHSIIKSATTGVFNFLNIPLGVAAFLSLLGAGSVAYFTKKILDERADQKQDLIKKDAPKIRKIVFRTVPLEGAVTQDASGNPVVDSKKYAEKLQKAAEELRSRQDVTIIPNDVILSSLIIMMDKLAAESKVLNDPAVQKEMMKINVSKRQLFKYANDFANRLVPFLMRPENESFRRELQRIAMQQHPILKYFTKALDIPVVGRFVDKKTEQFLQNVLSKNIIMPKQLKTNFFKSSSLIDIPTSVREVFTSALGSSAATGKDLTEDDIANAFIKAQILFQEYKNKKSLTPKEKAEAISLLAADPKAQEYLKMNEQKIRQLLQKFYTQNSSN